MGCVIPFWIRLLMPSRKNFGPSDFVHPIKNVEGKKSANFRRRIRIFFNKGHFLCEMARLDEIFKENEYF